MLPPVLLPPHMKKRHIIPVGNNIHPLLPPDPDLDLEQTRRKQDRVGWPNSVLVQAGPTLRPRVRVDQVDEKALYHLILVSLDEKAHYRLVYHLRPIRLDNLSFMPQTWISIPRLRADPPQMMNSVFNKTTLFSNSSGYLFSYMDDRSAVCSVQ